MSLAIAADRNSGRRVCHCRVDRVIVYASTAVRAVSQAAPDRFGVVPAARRPEQIYPPAKVHF